MLARYLVILLVSLYTLQAAENWIGSLGGRESRDVEGNVTAVSLRAAWVTDVELARLADFPKLRSLDLSHTHINDGALESLKDLHHLVDLDLTYAEHITDAGLARLRDVRSLERLVLEGTKITDSGMSSIAALTNLRSLSLRSTQITDSALDQLESLTNLEELAIGANRISGFGFVYLQMLPQLKQLDLSGVQLTDDGVWSVALSDLNIQSIAALKGLESLNLAATELIGVPTVPDGGIRETATIQVTDLGVEELRQLPNLRRLDLTRAEITARGLRSLSALPHLEQLVLAYTGKLEPPALSALAEFKSLQVLDLSGVTVVDCGLAQALERSGSLKLVGWSQ